MTQEEKQLLLVDICARLPYGIKGIHRGKVHELFTIDGREVNSACIQVDGYDAWFSVDTFKPYLRPLSSMTKEEREYLEELSNFKATPSVVRDKVDFYLERHLDYRGLIPMGLALEAPEGMYKTE